MGGDRSVRIWLATLRTACLLRGVDPAKSMGSSSKNSILTKRDIEIIRLLLDGCTNREIGESLDLSPLTVRNYLGVLFSKHHVRNRTELVARFVAVRRSKR